MTPSEAIDLLSTGRPVCDQTIEGSINLKQLAASPSDSGPTIMVPVQILRSRIQEISAFNVAYNPMIELRESHIGAAYLNASYFLGGLTIRDCTFDGPVDFSCGGHNKGGSFLVENTTFNGFVNFEDCWFMGPVILRNVKFAGGTNLFALRGHPTEVRFDIPPTLESIEGDVHQRVPLTPHSPRDVVS